MKKSELKKMIKEVVRESMTSPAHAPSKPRTEPAVHPGTKEPEPKRRTLVPDKETTPKTKPKAESAGLKENEKQILSNIVKRFQKLK